MTDFKPGDKVRCTDDEMGFSGKSIHIQSGTVYTVVEVFKTKTAFGSENEKVFLEEVPSEIWFYKDKFELVRETELETAIKEIVEGNLIHKPIDSARTNIVNEIVLFLNEKYNLI